MEQSQKEYNIIVPCPVHLQKNVEYLCTNPKSHSQRLFCSTCVFQAEHCKHDNDLKDFNEFIFEQQQQFYRSGLHLSPEIFELLDLKDHYLLNFKEQAQKQVESIEHSFEVLIHKVVNVLNGAKEDIIATLEKCIETYAHRYQILNTKAIQNFQKVFFVSKFRSFDEMAQNFMPFTFDSVSFMTDSLIENYYRQCIVPEDVMFAFENVMAMQESTPTFDIPKFDAIKSQIYLLSDKLKKLSSNLIITKETEWRPHVSPVPIFSSKKTSSPERSSMSQRNRSQGDLHATSNKSQPSFIANDDQQLRDSAKRLYERLPRIPSVSIHSITNNETHLEIDYENRHQTDRAKLRCLQDFNTEHSRTVYSITNLGNNLIATASDDSLIKLWDLSTLKCISVLKGHNAGVRSLAILGNKNLVSGSWDRYIKIWNTGKLGYRKDSHNENQKDLNQNEEDMSAEREGILSRVQCIHTLKGHINSVLCVGVLPDGQTIMSGSTDCSIKLWSSLTGSLLKTMTGHTNEVVCLVATRLNPNIVSGSGDKSIKVWNYEKKSLRPCIKTLNGHNGFIWTLELLDDDCTLVSGGLDRIIKIWNIDTGDCLKVLMGHNNQILLVKRFKENTIISADAEGIIKIWNIQKWNLITTIKRTTDKQPIYCSTISQDNTIVVSGANKKVIIWG